MTGSGVLAIGVGAALGAWLRWILNVFLNPVLPALPLGTLAANLIGGYLVGVAVELLYQHASLPPEVRLFVITGFLGGLTTFSSFSGEAVILLERGQYAWFAALVASHVAGSITLTLLGVYSVRILTQSA